MRTLRAAFSVIKVTGKVVYLVDLDLGHMSVTNDAEAVVERILQNYPDRRIVYRDTCGDWDELVHDGTQFTGFAHWTGDIPA